MRRIRSLHESYSAAEILLLFGSDNATAQGKTNDLSLAFTRAAFDEKMHCRRLIVLFLMKRRVIRLLNQ